MDRKEKYRNENRDKINERARKKYAANKHEMRAKAVIKMKRHRENYVRNTYPEYFKMSDEALTKEWLRLRAIKGSREAIELKNDVFLIRRIRGFITHKPW